MGVVLVAGSGVVFSFTALLFRGVEGATDWQFLTLRGTGSAIALASLLWLRHDARPVRRSAYNWQSLVAGVLLASMSMLFILALSRTTAALIAFLQSAAPFSGALFGWVILGEIVDRRTWAAMAAAVVGVAIMVGTGIEAGSTSGVLLAALIPVLLGLYNVLVKAAPHSDPVVPALVGAVVLMVGSATVAVSTDGLAVSGRDLVLGLTAGGVLLGLGLPMFNLGHQSVPAAQVSLLLMTEVVLSPVWVWIWPGETPTTGTLVGGAIILAAVVALSLTGHGGRRFWVARR